MFLKKRQKETTFNYFLKKDLNLPNLNSNPTFKERLSIRAAIIKPGIKNVKNFLLVLKNFVLKKDADAIEEPVEKISCAYKNQAVQYNSDNFKNFIAHQVLEYTREGSFKGKKKNYT